MKAIILSLFFLFPAICHSEASPFITDDNYLDNMRAAQARRKAFQKHEEKEFQRDLFMLDQITQDAGPQDPPIIMYSPRNTEEMHILGVREAFGSYIPDKVQPRIIYQLGK